MKNKYYTPTIEEFHVGFEYEKKEIVSKGNFLEEDWVEQKCESQDLFEISRHYTEYGIFNKEDYRVKFLDREDIESLGWFFKESKEENEFGCVEYQADFKGNDWRLQYWEKNQYTIERFDTIGKTVWFCGTIKNKSELKRLMQMLNIEVDGKS